MRFARVALPLALLAAMPAAAQAAASAADCTQVEAAFTPGDDIAGLIEARIRAARRTVDMQAYLFTDRRIARALIGALKRGVEVQVIGDAGQYRSGGLRWLASLHRAGARIFLDQGVAAAHNKIVIVDAGAASAAVVTGSYNFTHAAQDRNAENVVVLTGNPRVTDRFAANFRALRDQSTPWP